jgi:hypothetical protein
MTEPSTSERAGTLRLEGGAPRGLLAAPLFALLLLGAAELLARLLLAPLGASWEYWEAEAAAKFERYRELASTGEAPDVLIVGDSTGARDIDPDALRAGLGAAAEAYNLAWPSNFPLAFRCTTLPLLAEGLDAPRLVVASLSPRSFLDHPSTKRLEENLLSSRYCRRLAGESSLGERLYLRRIEHVLPVLLARPREVSARGFMPHRTTKLKGGQAGPAPEASADPSDRPAEEALSAERLALIRELGALSKARGFRLVFLIPPRLGTTPGKPNALTAAYLAALEAAREEYGFTILDQSYAPYLSAEHFYDTGHLRFEGAQLFSKELAKALAPLLPPKS